MKNITEVGSLLFSTWGPQADVFHNYEEWIERDGEGIDHYLTKMVSSVLPELWDITANMTVHVVPELRSDCSAWMSLRYCPCRVTQWVRKVNSFQNRIKWIITYTKRLFFKRPAASFKAIYDKELLHLYQQEVLARSNRLFSFCYNFNISYDKKIVCVRNEVCKTIVCTRFIYNQNTI
jgi:hypothetical protein